MAQKEKTLGADETARQVEVSKENQESNEEENGVVGFVKDAANSAYKGLSDVASQSTLGQRAAGLVGSAADAYAKDGVGAIGNAVKDGVDAVGKSISNGTVLEDAANTVGGAYDSINDGMASTGANALLAGGKVLGGAASLAGSGISQGADAAMTNVNNLADAAQKTLETAGSVLGDAQNAVGDFANGAAAGVKDAAGNVAAGVSGAAAGLGSAAKSFLMGAARTAGTGVGMATNAGNAVGEFAGDVLDAYDEGVESQVPSSEEKSTTRRVPNAELMGTDNGASNDFSLADSMTSKYC